jgi:hypothetical protein
MNLPMRRYSDTRFTTIIVERKATRDIGIIRTVHGHGRHSKEALSAG